MQILENHPLAPHTTMHIGGPAKKYIEVDTQDELVDALTMARKESLPVFILGAGSNTLISDDGFLGCVIRLRFNAVEWKDQEDGSTLVTMDGGADFDAVVEESCRRNLGGIESLSGIPGTAGGSLVQNIGAYGQEISETFVSAVAIHKVTGDIVDLSRDQLGFAYRQTTLKTPDNALIVVSVTLRLKPFDMDAACKRCAEHGFKKIAMSKPQNANALRRLVLETRRSKAMCYDPNDYNTHSVGSFFVNPVVPNEEAQRLNAAHILKYHKPMPSFPADGGTKLSAAWLIENSGFTRGYGYKGAALSAQHCLAIVNRQNATCADVVEFAQDISKRVYLLFHIELTPEVVYLTPSGIEKLACKTQDVEVNGVTFRPNPLFL